MKQMCPAKMEAASLQITCEHFFIHPIIPKMFVYVFLFADYQIRQSQKSSCSCIFNWDGWRHSFWKATNLTTFMTPGTWNMQIMQPVACWCLSNQLFRYQRCTSSAAAWIPRRRPKMCARLRSFAAKKWFRNGIFLIHLQLVKHQKKYIIYIYILHIRIILRSWYPLSPVDQIILQSSKVWQRGETGSNTIHGRPDRNDYTVELCRIFFTNAGVL